MDLHFFDRNEPIAILDRRLPHWSQPGVVCFITFRTDDSMPRTVVQNWHVERRIWLRQHGINPDDQRWKMLLRKLEQPIQEEFYATFSNKWHEELDRCHGACVLRDPENSKTVADSLLKFDGDRYLMTDFVVMPNHIHLQVAFKDDDSMLNHGSDSLVARSTNASERPADSGSRTASIIWCDPKLSSNTSVGISPKTHAKRASRTVNTFCTQRSHHFPSDAARCCDGLRIQSLVLGRLDRRLG
ncbi:hypothetical protein [Fuerstiella marisgermanici]|uniref:Transposase IS200-like domain-containing protein n=1 Tax=Fuerstiella marisgermanici TaxID=1891926 RepID=A0A1P8WN83_9PLAN|nr:hypothetical protein [Fuerstiella marisgermanici]APZ95523.1 hypothetical protein Fuma_05182 [Fuerstiella marisgermanici]